MEVYDFAVDISRERVIMSTFDACVCLEILDVRQNYINFSLWQK
jgi:hypothetical protein